MDKAKAQGHNVPPNMPRTPEQDMPLSEKVMPQVHERRRRKRRGGPYRVARRIRRRLKRVNWLLAGGIALGLIAALVMGGLVLVSNAQNGIDQAWHGLDRDWQTISNTPMTELTLEDFDRLRTRVNELNSSLALAKRNTFFLRPFTFLNADLDTSLKSLEAAQELGLAANDILAGLQPTIFFVAGGQETETLSPQFSSGARLVELTSLGRSRFRTAQQHLDAAQATISQFNLAEVSPAVLETFDGLAQYHRQLAEINDVLLDAPTLLDTALGITEPRTYLILSQNSDELRPSGGYISTYGWLQVDRGRVARYDYYPTTSTSPNPPNRALASELDIPEWWIPYGEPIYAAWDGSWSPDFPTTAKMAAWYYDQGNNPQSPVDGVIAIDIVAFEYVLEGLGEVVVPGYNETVAPSNFRDVIYRIRAEGEGDTPHKRFLVALYRQIFDDWQRADQAQSGALRQALLRALQEKHIMIYMRDESLNAALDALGWSGKQETGTGTDYLMVADANLGNKSNRSITRQITYDVRIQADGTLDSRLAVNYDYLARVAEQDPAVKPAHYSDIDYHNLLQLFVPPESILHDAEGFSSTPQVVEADDYTAFVSVVSVAYDTSERYRLAYTTPALVEQFGPYRRYTLRLEKQPGTLTDFANVQVTLPPDATIISVSPAASATFEIDSPILEFRVQLMTDKTIEIVYRH